MGAPGGLALVARKGSPTPDSPAGTVYQELAGAVINNAGQVLFVAYVDPVGGADEYLESLWHWSPGANAASAGTLKLIARQGQQAAGVPAGIIYGSSDFSVPNFGFVMNRAGQIVFRSRLAGPGVNDANNNNTGWWITSAAGESLLVSREGDPFDAGGGNMQTVSEIHVQTSNLASGGADGLPRVLSDAGEFVLHAGVGLFGRTTGVFRAKLPGVLAAPPLAITRAADSLSPGTATLNGQMNPAEYALKIDPLKPTAGGIPYRAFVPIDGQLFLSMSYRVWADVVAAGVVYEPEPFIRGELQTLGFIDEVDPDAAVIPGSTARRTRIPIDPVDLTRPEKDSLTSSFDAPDSP